MGAGDQAALQYPDQAVDGLHRKGLFLVPLASYDGVLYRLGVCAVRSTSLTVTQWANDMELAGTYVVMRDAFQPTSNFELAEYDSLALPSSMRSPGLELCVVSQSI